MTESSVAEAWEIARNELGDGGHGCLGCNLNEADPAGVKTRLILWTFSARLKSCPDTKPASIEFFRSL
jgi:hypothetical protein